GSRPLRSHYGPRPRPVRHPPRRRGLPPRRPCSAPHRRPRPQPQLGVLTMINFIFMLTHNDSTVPGAIDYVEKLAATGLRYIGFKDVGADPATQKAIVKAAHDAGLETMLEVVSV